MTARSSTSRCIASRRASVDDDLMRKHRVGAGERVHGVDHHLFGDAAHFGDQALDRIEFPVVGFDGVVVHGAWSFCRKVASDGVRLGEA